MVSLAGKVITLICRGSDSDRTIALALAEAGAGVAVGTVSADPTEEFATASIANEVWAIGREQFNRTLDAADPAAAAAFAAEVCDRLGRCDGLVISPGAAPEIDFDEFSRDEWDVIATGGLAAPLISAQAFSRVIERGGGGHIILVVDAAAHGDVAGSILTEGQRAMALNMGIAWSDRPLRAVVVSREDAASLVVRALASGRS